MVVQVVSFIERAALWRTPPIFYPCVLELMNEPEKAAKTCLYLQEQLRASCHIKFQPGDTVNQAGLDTNNAGVPCTTLGTRTEAGCGAIATKETLLQRCIRSRAAASLLVRKHPQHVSHSACVVTRGDASLLVHQIPCLHDKCFSHMLMALESFFGTIMDNDTLFKPFSSVHLVLSCAAE
jgi:hypothetical protein